LVATARKHAAPAASQHGRWDPDPQNVDDAEAIMLAVADRNIDDASFAKWVGAHVGCAFDGRPGHSLGQGQ